MTATSIQINTDLGENLTKVTELCEKLDEANENCRKLRFITIRDMQKATGWSLTTVQELFRMKDFPCCDYGKEKVAEINAVIKFFSVPRRK